MTFLSDLSINISIFFVIKSIIILSVNKTPLGPSYLILPEIFMLFFSKSKTKISPYMTLSICFTSIFPQVAIIFIIVSRSV